MSRYVRVGLVMCLVWGAACRPESAPAGPVEHVDPTVPSAPRDVEARAEVGEASVTWSAPEQDGGRAVTGYEVRGEPEDATMRVLVEGTTARVTGLRAGGTYAFSVVALNAVGPSAPARASAVILPDVPGAPPAPVVQRRGAQVEVSWEPPGQSGGRPVTGYRVLCSPQGVQLELEGAVRATRVTGLPLGEPATCTVRARNPVGEGPESAPSAVVVPGIAPSAPQNVGAVAGIREVTLSWSPPARTGGLPVTGYVVGVLPGAASQQVDASVQRFTVRGLSDGTSYTLFVAALNDEGRGTTTLAPPQRTPSTPGAPLDVKAEPQERAVRVSWTVPTEDGGMPIAGYVVEVQPGGRLVRVGEEARSATVTDLASTQAYTFTVSATSDVGRGARSPATSPVRPLPEPVQVTALAVPTGPAGCVSVEYTLRQPEGLAVDVTVEVDPGTGTFQRVTQAGSTTHEGLLARAGSPAGTVHRFLWNRAGDVPGAASVQVRVGAQVAGTVRSTRTVSLALPAAASRCEVRLDTSLVRTLERQSPSASVVADFDGDGKRDVVLNAGGLLLLRGLGHGGFHAPQKLETGTARPDIFPTLAAADLDGDGRMDLIWTSRSGGVEVARGNGDGSFQAAVHSDVPDDSGGSWRGLAVADFNDDGRPDVALSQADGLLMLLFNQGDGQLGRAVAARPDYKKQGARLIAADLDRDGRMDLVAHHPMTSSSPAGIAALLSNGDGSFRVRPVRAPSSSGSSAVAELTGDGRLDLLVAEHEGTLVRLFLHTGDGRGGFASERQLGSLTQPSGCGIVCVPLATADLDGDGLRDVAVGVGLGEVAVLRGLGEGAFTTAQRWPLGTSSAVRLTAEDLDSDGVADLLSLQGEDMRVWRGGPRRREVPTSPFSGLFAAGDITGDGWTDVVSFGAQGLQVRVGGPGGVSALPPKWVEGSVSRLLLAQLDADPALDVVTLPDPFQDKDVVGLWSGRADGGLSRVGDIAVGATAVSVRTGDWNEDGQGDLLFVTQRLEGGGTRREVRLALGRGDGTFPLPGVLWSAVETGLQAEVGDVDGDGHLDIVVQRAGTGLGAKVFRGQGDGTFQEGPERVCGGAYGVTSVSLADLDQDGVLDLLCAGRRDPDFSQWISVLRGTGGGNFTALPAVRADGVGDALLVTDLDGDGQRDVLSTSSNAAAVLWLRGLGEGRLAAPESFGTFYTFGETMTIALVDMDGDGVTEVLSGGAPFQPATLLRRY